MKTNVVLVILVVTFLVSGASIAFAQPEPQFVLVTRHHVKAGMAAQYEAAIQEGNELLANAGNPYGTLASVSEGGGTYTYLSFLENWAAFDARREAQVAALSGAQELGQRFNSTLERTSSTVMRTAPALGHVPDNPRLELSELGFGHQVSIYLRPGTFSEAAEALREAAEMFERHNIPDRRFVQFAVRGDDTPMLTVTYLGRDAVDYYTRAASRVETFGQEWQDFVAKMNGVARRIEMANFIPRPDLSYQPAN